MKWWDWMLWSSFFECWVSSQFFSLSSFTLIKRFFRSSLFLAIRVISYVYLRLIFLPALLIPAGDLWSTAFHMMYSTCKLNEQGDNKQPWRTPFPALNHVHFSMSGSNSCFLNCIQVSQETGKVFWYSHFLKIFSWFLVIHTDKDFSIVDEAEVDVFLELSCFVYDPMDAGNLISVPLPFLNPTWTSESSCTFEAWLGEFWALLF